jgi:ribosomal protein S18 acetylase RimI-like enzyme
MADALVFETVTASALRADHARALRLAELAVSAQLEFYSHIPLPREVLLDAVARQMAQPAFDMAEVFVLRGAEDLAMVADIDLAALPTAQMAALTAFLRLVPQRASLGERLRAFSAGIEPIADRGRYISRFAVASAVRGQGIGRTALRAYLDRFAATNVHLHVHRDNASAVALYRSLGFVPRSAAGFAFPAYSRAR